MPLFSVTYDLVKENSSFDYQSLWDALNDVDGVKTQFSGWLVGYDTTQQALYKYLRKTVDSNDRLMVVQITKRPDWSTGFKGTKAIIDKYFPT